MSRKTGNILVIILALIAIISSSIAAYFLINRPANLKNIVENTSLLKENQNYALYYAVNNSTPTPTNFASNYQIYKRTPKENQLIFTIGNEQINTQPPIESDNKFYWSTYQSVGEIDTNSDVAKKIYIAPTNFHITGMAINNDQKLMYVWMDKIVQKPADRQYSLITVNLRNDTTSAVSANYPSDAIGFFQLNGFIRDKNQLIIRQGLGDSWGGFYLYSIKNNSFEKFKDYSVFSINGDGNYYLTNTGTADDPCNAMMGNGPSTFEVAGIFDGKKYGSIGEKGKLINIVNTSPDGNEILYYTENPFTPKESFTGCNQAKNDKNRRSYYDYNISTGTSQPVSVYMKVIKNWNNDKPIIEQTFVCDDLCQMGTNKIYLDGNLVLELEKTPIVLGYFYQ